MATVSLSHLNGVGWFRSRDTAFVLCPAYSLGCPGRILHLWVAGRTWTDVALGELNLELVVTRRLSPVLLLLNSVYSHAFGVYGALPLLWASGMERLCYSVWSKSCDRRFCYCSRCMVGNFSRPPATASNRGICAA